MAEQTTKLEVLLGTFMGENFLEAQLKSILDQSYNNIHVLIRDEGSMDLSPLIIAKFKIQEQNIKVIDNKDGRLGCCGNFSRLLEASNAEYIMLSDQDDIWLPEKVSATFEEMVKIEGKYGKNVPILVHTNLKVVGTDLQVISDSYWRYQHLDPEKGKYLNRLLVQNVVTGCTVMINRALRDLVGAIHEDAVMHDWWLALVASAFGKIGYVSEPTILYRQHGKNVVGAKRWSSLSAMKRVLAPRAEARESLLRTQRQARAFLERFERKLPPKQAEMVRRYAEFGNYCYVRKLYYIYRFRLFKIGLIRNIGLLTSI